MGAHDSRQQRLLYGISRRWSIRWLVAAVGFVLAPLAVLFGPWLVGVAAAEFGLSIGGPLDGDLFLPALFALGALGIVASTVQAYQNDGLFVSAALAPWAGWMLIVEGIIWWTKFTDPPEWARMEGGAYLYVFPGAFALFVGVVGFVFGAGARRLVVRYNRNQGGTV